MTVAPDAAPSSVQPDASPVAPDLGSGRDRRFHGRTRSRSPRAHPPARPRTPPHPSAPFPLEAVKGAKSTLFGRVGTHTEGPSYREGSVYFASDGNGLVRADETGKMFKYHPKLAPVGTYLLADGSMLVCDKGHTVVQVFKDGSVGSLFSAEDHNRIDFCNDLSIDAKGDIFFTNPHAGDIWRLTVAGTLDKVVGGQGSLLQQHRDRSRGHLALLLHQRWF